MGSQLREFIGDQQGTATVEYALLLALMVVATCGAWMGLAAKVKSTLEVTASTLRTPLG